MTASSPRTVVARRAIHPGLSLAMIAAGLLHAAAGVICPPLRSSASAQLAVVAAHPTRWYWYTMLLVLGSAAAIPAVIGLLRLAAARMPRAGAIGGTLVTLGFLASLVDSADQFWTWQMVAPGADRRQMTALLDRFDNAAGTGLIFQISGICLLIGTVLLTIALVRAPAVPSWATLAFGTAVFVNIAGFAADSIPAVTASLVLLLIGMGAIGVRTLRGAAAATTALSPAEPAVA